MVEAGKLSPQPFLVLVALPKKRSSCAMEAVPKRRKVSWVKAEETADPELWAAGWRLDPNEDSQIMVPPPEEDGQGDGQGEGGQGEESPQREEERKEPEEN